mgnify:CR=1 FL=1
MRYFVLRRLIAALPLSGIYSRLPCRAVTPIPAAICEKKGLAMRFFCDACTLFSPLAQLSPIRHYDSDAIVQSG